MVLRFEFADVGILERVASADAEPLKLEMERGAKRDVKRFGFKANLFLIGKRSAGRQRGRRDFIEPVRIARGTCGLEYQRRPRHRLSEAEPSGLMAQVRTGEAGAETKRKFAEEFSQTRPFPFDVEIVQRNRCIPLFFVLCKEVLATETAHQKHYHYCKKTIQIGLS